MKSEKLIIAHRGASHQFPENTLPAFQKAIELGADVLELDVRMTGDGILAVIHDEDWEGNKISETEFKELKRLSGNQVLALEEVLNLAKGKIKLDVEIKEQGYEERLCGFLKEYLPYEDFFVTSKIEPSLIKIKNFDASLRSGLILGKRQLVSAVDLLKRENFGYKVLVLRDFFIKLGWHKLLKFNPEELWVWTANQPKHIKFFLKDKLINGIVTDVPDLAIKLRDEFI